MPTREEMDQVIRNYCRGRCCGNCVIYADPAHIAGQCGGNNTPFPMVEHYYNLVLSETEIAARKEAAKENNSKKGNDIMVNDIITNEERKYLLDNMKKLLSEYDYRYTEDALNTIISTWAINKADLIAAFKKHPNYVKGKFMIAFDQDYVRDIDAIAVKEFSNWLKFYPIRDLVSDIPPEIEEQRVIGCNTYLPGRLWDFLTSLSWIPDRTISEITANNINQMLPNIHAHTGQKTSRVINKICKYLGYDKHPDYNREFAKYADALSPMTIKRHTVLSINPLDYLTMSFGNSWASCHTIDKENKRDMPNNYSGCYSSGTISYMLDPSSMVFYTVDASASGEELWNEPKINRQMFHYGQEKLVQGRLYPQDNDGAQGDELYNSYRAIVQEIMAKILEVPNLWVVSKGISAADRFIYSYGTHYKDYKNYSNCTLSRLKGSENEELFVVGHDPICIYCGTEHDCEENICHCDIIRCSDCGEELNEDDVIYVNGYPYCRDCVSYCECCSSYHRETEFYIESENIYVCASCFDEYYDICRECGENFNREDLFYPGDGNVVCENCLEEHYTYCDECGEMVNNSNIHLHGNRWICDDCYDKTLDDEAC